MDGNDSIIEDDVEIKLKKHEIAMNLPTVAAYNVRSLFPKVGNFKTDMIERGVSVAFVSEIWG